MTVTDKGDTRPDKYHVKWYRWYILAIYALFASLQVCIHLYFQLFPKVLQNYDLLKQGLISGVHLQHVGTDCPVGQVLFWLDRRHGGVDEQRAGGRN